jgi:hypothetical protein
MLAHNTVIGPMTLRCADSFSYKESNPGKYFGYITIRGMMSENLGRLKYV